MFIMLALTASTLAQTAQSDDEDFQSWNDLQLSIGLSKRVEVLLMTTLRVGHNARKLDEARVGAGLSFKPTDALTLSPMYHYHETRASDGRFRTEHRYSMRGVYRFPLKKIGLSHRSVYEYRIRSSSHSWRYRPSITFEKALPERFIPKAKFIVTEEVFYVSTTRKFSRNRFSLGISKTLTKQLNLDVYYLRQNDGYSHPGDLNVLGTAWKFHF